MFSTTTTKIWFFFLFYIYNLHISFVAMYDTITLKKKQYITYNLVLKTFYFNGFVCQIPKLANTIRLNDALNYLLTFFIYKLENCSFSQFKLLLLLTFVIHASHTHKTYTQNIFCYLKFVPVQ